MTEGNNDGEIKKLSIILVPDFKTITVEDKDKKKVEKKVPDYEKALADSNISKITDYSKSTANVLIAQFNPETFSLSIETEKAGDESNQVLNNQSKKDNLSNEKTPVTKSNSLSFKLIFDSSFSESPDVKVAVDFLNKLFYKDNTVVANNVIIKYGSVINFQGSPTKLTLNYLLFDSAGHPIRVAADLEFSGRNITEFEARKDVKNLTIEGYPDDSESLGSYTAKKLGSAAMYTAVAKANKLPNLMKLPSGVKLKIPSKK